MNIPSYYTSPLHPPDTHYSNYHIIIIQYITYDSRNTGILNRNLVTGMVSLIQDNLSKTLSSEIYSVSWR